jgi:hypothetical protein
VPLKLPGPDVGHQPAEDLAREAAREAAAAAYARQWLEALLRLGERAGGSGEERPPRRGGPGRTPLTHRNGGGGPP